MRQMQMQMYWQIRLQSFADGKLSKTVEWVGKMVAMPYIKQPAGPKH